MKTPKWLSGTGSLERDIWIVTWQIAEILIFLGIIELLFFNI